VINVTGSGVPDVHSEKPAFPVEVKSIGLRNIPSPPLVSGNYVIQPVFRISVNLPGDVRGAHLSRIYGVYASIIAQHREFKMDLLRSIALRLLEVNEYSSMASVSMKGRLYYKVEGRIPEYSGNGFVMAGVEYSREKGALREYIGGSIYGLTTCPCAKAVSLHLYGEPYTHMQKVKVQAIIESIRIDVEPLELFGKLRELIVTPRNYLKRLDEAEVVRKVHENPLFTEDLARAVSVELAKAFAGSVGLEGEVLVRVKSYETIHEYMVESTVRSKINELLKVVA